MHFEPEAVPWAINQSLPPQHNGPEINYPIALPKRKRLVPLRMQAPAGTQTCGTALGTCCGVPGATTGAWLPAGGKPSLPAQGFFGHTSPLKPLWPCGCAWEGLSCSLLIPVMLPELQESNKNTKLGHGAQSLILG